MSEFIAIDNPEAFAPSHLLVLEGKSVNAKDAALLLNNAKACAEINDRLLRQYSRLYIHVDRLIAEIGANGEIQAHENVVLLVIEALGRINMPDDTST